ncbi:MAG: OadG family protein [Lachnospiraceae bacterium]|nr:OadG family protein [Lachnospiraceae bacterium]
MKHFKKILLIPLFLITACLIMTGCAKTAVQEETENKAAIEAADVASIQDFTDQQFAQQLVKANYEDFQSRVDSGEVVISRIFDNDLAQRWKTFTEKHGAIQKAEVAETNKTDDGYNCKLILTGEDGKMMALTITYDKGGYPLSTLIEDYTDDATKTVGSKMGEAGINIVVGLGVVFLILTFLTFFISLFKYLNVAGRKEGGTCTEACQGTCPDSSSCTCSSGSCGNSACRKRRTDCGNYRGNCRFRRHFGISERICRPFYQKTEFKQMALSQVHGGIENEELYYYG